MEEEKYTLIDTINGIENIQHPPSLNNTHPISNLPP